MADDQNARAFALLADVQAALDVGCGEPLRVIRAALTEAHAAGAEPYAREALLVLSGAGIPTPERGYVADGGAGLMGGDLRRLWEAGRRAALDEAEGIAKECAPLAATMHRRIAALKDRPHG